MAHYEALAITAEGFAKLAMISVMVKRLTQTKPHAASSKLQSLGSKLLALLEQGKTVR